MSWETSFSYFPLCVLSITHSFATRMLRLQEGANWQWCDFSHVFPGTLIITSDSKKQMTCHGHCNFWLAVIESKLLFFRKTRGLVLPACHFCRLMNWGSSGNGSGDGQQHWFQSKVLSMQIKELPQPHTLGQSSTARQRQHPGVSHLKVETRLEFTRGGIRTTVFYWLHFHLQILAKNLKGKPFFLIYKWVKVVLTHLN